MLKSMLGDNNFWTLLLAGWQDILVQGLFLHFFSRLNGSYAARQPEKMLKFPCCLKWNFYYFILFCQQSSSWLYISEPILSSFTDIFPFFYHSQLVSNFTVTKPHISIQYDTLLYISHQIFKWRPGCILSFHMMIQNATGFSRVICPLNIHKICHWLVWHLTYIWWLLYFMVTQLFNGLDHLVDWHLWTHNAM